jgi:drug/metabolite transporter (DMT)-like permease
MMSALIAATLAAVCYSLWVRRQTRQSRFEAGASLNIALQGCAVLLMSPWASATFGPRLHGIVGPWNVEDLLGLRYLRLTRNSAGTSHAGSPSVDGFPAR